MDGLVGVMNWLHGYMDGWMDCWMWKEGNVLFNDALNTFYLRLYGVRHMGKGPFR